MTEKNKRALEELRVILEGFFLNYSAGYDSEKCRQYLEFFNPNHANNINLLLCLPSPLECIVDLSDVNEKEKNNKYNDLCLAQIDIIIKYLRNYGYGAYWNHQA